jgi:hypothetical protein
MTVNWTRTSQFWGKNHRLLSKGLVSRKLLPAAREREPNRVILLSRVQKSIQFGGMRHIEALFLPKLARKCFSCCFQQLQTSSTLRPVAAYATPGLYPSAYCIGCAVNLPLRLCYTCPFRTRAGSPLACGITC